MQDENPRRSLEETLQDLFVSIEADARFTEALVKLRDESVLYFCHRVGERRARSAGPEGGTGGHSDALLDAIRTFRLNTRHLEIFFHDGSRWEWRWKSRRTS